MRKNPQIFWSVVLLVIVGVFFVWVYWGDKKEVLDIIKNDPVQSPLENIPVGEGQEVASVSRDENIYKHKILGFSFSYAKDYNISSFGNYSETDGETILLQKNEGKDGLQVLINAFDENIVLDENRIKKDLPNLSIINPKNVIIGGDTNNVRGISFESNNSLSSGKSIEFWFVYKKNLYQITAKDNSGEVLNKILESWKLE